MCFTLVGDPVISFTWHPHGPHYANICELHLEAFLHAKCLAVSSLQAQRPFAATNHISHLHLRPDTTKRRVQPQTANVGKSLCWGVCHFISECCPSHCAWLVASTANTPIFDVAHESCLTLCRCQFSLLFSALVSFSVSAAVAKHTRAPLKRVLGRSEVRLCCYFTREDELQGDAGADSRGCKSSATSEPDHVTSVSRSEGQLFAAAHRACNLGHHGSVTTTTLPLLLICNLLIQMKTTNANMFGN